MLKKTFHQRTGVLLKVTDTDLCIIVKSPPSLNKSRTMTERLRTGINSRDSALERWWLGDLKQTMLLKTSIKMKFESDSFPHDSWFVRRSGKHRHVWHPYVHLIQHHWNKVVQHIIVSFIQNDFKSMTKWFNLINHKHENCQDTKTHLASLFHHEFHYTLKSQIFYKNIKNKYVSSSSDQVPMLEEICVQDMRKLKRQRFAWRAPDSLATETPRKCTWPQVSVVLIHQQIHDE